MCSVHFVWRQETAIIARVNAIIISRLFGVGSRQLFGLNVPFVVNLVRRCSMQPIYVFYDFDRDRQGLRRFRSKSRL